MHMAGRGGRRRAHPRAGGRVALPVVGALFGSSAGAVGILGRVVEVIGGCPLVVVDDVARRLFERVSSACVTWVLLPRWWSSTSAGAGCAWSRSCWTSGGCSRFPRARGRGGRARRWRVSSTVRGWLLLLPVLGPVEVIGGCRRLPRAGGGHPRARRPADSGVCRRAGSARVRGQFGVWRVAGRWCGC
jgi:hypothetical protein